MPNINRLTLAGHLGKDPELQFTKGGTAVCRFSVATTEGKDDKKKTEWTDVEVWGKFAESASKSLRKGDAVFIEGKKDTNEWTDKDGVKRRSVRLVTWGSVFKWIGSIEKAVSQPSQDEEEGDLPF